MEGFIVLDYAARYHEAYRELAKWVSEGKICYRVDVIDGLYEASSAINKLFDGSNKGKLIVRVSDEPPLKQ